MIVKCEKKCYDKIVISIDRVGGVLMNFGEKLKQIRKEKKISQQSLAEMIKVSLPNIRKWESNEKMPTKGEITKLCKCLKCQRSDLIKEMKEEKKELKQVEEVQEEITTLDDKVEEVVPVTLEQEKRVELHEEVQEETINEEIKKEEIKEEILINKHDKRKIKGLSRAINIISSIIRVLILICIPCLLIVMFLLPILSSKIEIHDNSIRIVDTNERITLHEDENNMWLDVNGERLLVGDKLESYAISVVREFLKDNSIERIVWHLEIELVLVALSLTIAYYLLRLMEKFFRNIHELTPFMKDNQKYLSICAWLIIGLIILDNGERAVFSSMLKTSFMPNIDLTYVLVILALFTLKYVFKYGEALENKSEIQVIEQ